MILVFFAYLCMHKMRILHIFNPEHDIALAAHLANFTAPHAARQLRGDLGFLPVLWASEGDVVMVDDIDYAMKCWERFRRYYGRRLQVPCLKPSNTVFAAFKRPVSSLQTQCLQPWGWDLALKSLLQRSGVDAALMPSDAQLEHIRQLSHRRTAARLLPELQMAGTVGEAFECATAEEVREHLECYGQVVLKAPWSSSGRGVRFVSADTGQATILNWLRNIIAAQGSVMVEPQYRKIRDFGMEFTADGRGGIRYCGLSLFHTQNGAYTGNILAAEHVKREMIGRYLPVGLLDAVRKRVQASLRLGDYEGAFGIDMMVVAGDGGFLLHPCVEINLRRTMGHVALAVSPADEEKVQVMRIVYNGNNYQLKIQRL